MRTISPLLLIATLFLAASCLPSKPEVRDFEASFYLSGAKNKADFVMDRLIESRMASLALQYYGHETLAIYDYNGTNYRSSETRMKDTADISGTRVLSKTSIPPDYIQVRFRFSRLVNPLPDKVARLDERTAFATVRLPEPGATNGPAAESVMLKARNQAIENAVLEEIRRKWKAPYPGTVTANAWYVSMPEESIENGNYHYRVRVKIELE